MINGYKWLLNYEMVIKWLLVKIFLKIFESHKITVKSHEMTLMRIARLYRWLRRLDAL